MIIKTGPKDIVHLGKVYFRDGGGGNFEGWQYDTYRRELTSKRHVEKIVVNTNTGGYVIQYISNLGRTGKDGIEINFY